MLPSICIEVSRSEADLFNYYSTSLLINIYFLSPYVYSRKRKGNNLDRVRWVCNIYLYERFAHIFLSIKLLCII